MTTALWECRGCGQLVFTAFSERGKRMIIHGDPQEDGNIVLRTETSRWDGSNYLVATVVPPKGAQEVLFGDDEGTRYVDHHALCSHADNFR